MNTKISISYSLFSVAQDVAPHYCTRASTPMCPLPYAASGQGGGGTGQGTLSHCWSIVSPGAKRWWTLRALLLGEIAADPFGQVEDSGLNSDTLMVSHCGRRTR